MLILYSKIVGAAIVELKNQSHLGFVSDLVIQKTDLKISGLMIKKPFLTWPSQIKAVSSADVIDISNQAVIVNNEDSISDLNDLVRIKESNLNGFSGIHQIVQTSNGKKIGVVFDYIIESSTLEIKKFYVRTLFSEKIIASSSVIKLEGKKLIIKDDFEKVKISSATAETSLI